MGTKSPTARELAESARRFPECILYQSTGPNVDDLEEFLWMEDSIYDFGARLTLIAGLAVGALYIEDALSCSHGGSRDEVFQDHLRQMLFSRGHNLGLASSLIQRASFLKEGSLEGIVDSDRPVVGFLLSRPRGPANRFRRQFKKTSERSLADLLDHVSFLTRFEFRKGKREVLFAGKPIDTWPFLDWNGRTLLRFNALVTKRELQIRFDFSGESEDIPKARRVDALGVQRLTEIARILEVDAGAFEVQVRPDLEGYPNHSIMPLFADRLSDLNSLAQKIYEESEESTRLDLWVKPNLRPGDRDNVEICKKLSNDVNFVINAIIKNCMDADPVSVLGEYFARETLDHEEYLKWLVHDEERRKTIQAEINGKRDEYRKKLEPFFCRQSDEDPLDKLVKRYHARLSGLRVVQLLNFEVVEQPILDDVTDYERRIGAFHDYLVKDAGDSAKITAGLMACGRAAEYLLRTLTVFYNSLRLFDPGLSAGLDTLAMEETDRYKKKLAEFNFWKTIRTFRDLIENPNLKKALRYFLGRDTFWPIELDFDPIDLLNSFRVKRNELAHKAPPTEEEARSAVSDLLQFLSVLTGDMGPQWRIFPAVLTLNVVTTNSCGVTSVKYILTSQESSDQPKRITLYTEQPLAENRGVYLALPHHKKTVDDLWVDPVLIPASFFMNKA